MAGQPVLGIHTTHNKLNLLSLAERYKLRLELKTAPNPTKVAPHYHQMPTSRSFVICYRFRFGADNLKNDTLRRYRHRRPKRAKKAAAILKSILTV